MVHMRIAVLVTTTVFCAGGLAVGIHGVLRETRIPVPRPVSLPSVSFSGPDSTADRTVIVNETFTEFTFGPDSGVVRICVAAGCRSLDEIAAWIRDQESQR